MSGLGRPFIGPLTWASLVGVLYIFETHTWQPGGLLLQFRTQVAVLTVVDILWLVLLVLDLADLLSSSCHRRWMRAVPYVFGLALICLVQALVMAMFRAF